VRAAPVGRSFCLLGRRAASHRRNAKVQPLFPQRTPSAGAGTHPSQALKLSAYGIPLDWIYQGRTTDLHPHIRAKISQLAS
jgi:hypothetical protein